MPIYTCKLKLFAGNYLQIDGGYPRASNLFDTSMNTWHFVQPELFLIRNLNNEISMYEYTLQNQKEANATC